VRTFLHEGRLHRACLVHCMLCCAESLHVHDLIHYLQAYPHVALSTFTCHDSWQSIYFLHEHIAWCSIQICLSAVLHVLKHHGGQHILAQCTSPARFVSAEHCSVVFCSIAAALTFTYAGLRQALLHVLAGWLAS
jgi:hypothetical protein